MAKRRAVPRYSQFLDVTDEKWQPRSCGIVALKSVMDSIGVKTPTIDNLIIEGLGINAYNDKDGWIHDGLARLARRHHLIAMPFDWDEKSPEEALQKLKKAIRTFPCIASVYRGFKKRNGGGHLIVVTKISRSEVLYNDPESHLRSRVRRSSSIERFIKGWKRRVIIVKG